MNNELLSTGNCQPTKEYVRNWSEAQVLSAVEGSNMQNKPNFPDTQMDASANRTKDYENNSNSTLGENKPNSNPNKPNKMQKEPVKAKTNPKQTQSNPILHGGPNERELLCRKEGMEMLLETAKFGITKILQKNHEFGSMKSTDATEGSSPFGGLEGPISERSRDAVNVNFGRRFFDGVSGVLWRSPL